MQVSGISVFAYFNPNLQKEIENKTLYKNRAFILKKYLVLFVFFIISHFYPFVNPEPQKKQDFALKNAHQNGIIKASKYGMTDTMGRMHSDAQFAGSSSVPAHVEMMGLIGAGNNPMVGATVAVAVAVEEAMKK